MSNCPFQVLPKLKERLIHDIESGVYQRGEKLLNERELCKVYHIGRSSIASVLKELHNERYVERIPVKGTFVRKDLQYQTKIVQIVFVSSDGSFSPEKIGLNSWSRNMEMIRGVFEAAAGINGVRMSLMYCPPTENPQLLHRYAEDLDRFDAVIFCGCGNQNLKAEFAKTGKPAIVLAPKLNVYPEIFPVVQVEYHAAILDYAQRIAKQKCPVVLLSRLGAEVDRDEEQKLQTELVEFFDSKQIPCQDLFLPITFDEQEAISVLKRKKSMLKQMQGKIVWVLNRCMVEPLCMLLEQHGITAEVYALQGGIFFQNHLPELYFLNEPDAEAGAAAVRCLTDSILHGKPVKSITLQPSLYCGKRKIT